MKQVLNFIAWASLGLLTVPAFMFLAGRLSLPAVKLSMLIATVLWFACTVPGMWSGGENSES